MDLTHYPIGLFWFLALFPACLWVGVLLTGLFGRKLGDDFKWWHGLIIAVPFSVLNLVATGIDPDLFNFLLETSLSLIQFFFMFWSGSMIRPKIDQENDLFPLIRIMFFWLLVSAAFAHSLITIATLIIHGLPQ